MTEISFNDHFIPVRRRNLILTMATGDKFLEDKTFWVFVKSLVHVDNADVVVMTYEMNTETRAKLLAHGLYVVDVPPKDAHALLRDRHLAFWHYLSQFGDHYEHVLATDCRDVVFQGNPFDWVPQWKGLFDHIKGEKQFLDHFVVLVAEGHKMSASGFALTEHFEFERDVPFPYMKSDRNRHVVNGGTFMGTSRAMKDWHFLVWITALKTLGRCTDQATINWLLYYLEHDASYQVSFPQTDNLCLTGEGVKEGAVSPVLDKGKLLNPDGKMYYMVHQWDRLDGLREDILAQYGC